ncbi:hypothetical protein ACP70R_010960 [Stipagrostis hirtigluma subsp. patula]
MEATKKRVAIVGAGASGLAACKHALAKGFRPVVFEAGEGVGGVWRRTLASTRLQTPATSYRFSDFPWPADTELFPRHDQVVAYLVAYARRFGVLERVRFGSRVVAAEYAGVPEEQVAAWERWAGNGEAFGDGSGEWLLTVHHRGSEATQVYRFDFLILCIGRYGGVAHTPTFPPNRGPEVFRGRVLHSMEYSGMDAAAELIRGKRVAVVGSGKSAFDTVAECAAANGPSYPCTMVCRTPRWMVNGGFVWGVSLGHLFANRLSELTVHKPGEGLALSLLAALLAPLRWVISKLTEAYYKIQIPMMEKHGMVPEESFSASIAACRLGVLPDGFYDRVEDGSIVIRRARSSWGFCADGLVLDGTGERVAADVVVLATGYRGDDKLRAMFVSPRLGEMVAGGAAPLYRQCVHPRIPQMAVVGYSDSLTSVYPYEMMAKWVAHLLDGAFRLPAVARMERSAAEWGEYARTHGGGGGRQGPCIGAINTWFNDELCRDMGYEPRRKKVILAEWLQPYGPADYAGIS